MTDVAGGVPLTDEQRAVASAPADERQLVTAPAGSGKTHVLVARLTELTDVQGLAAGDEVLLLSFSRAAVAEVRRRSAAAAGDAAFVAASTFDAFATLLLASEYGDESWSRLGFDGRIRAATELLDDGDSECAPIAHCRHVLIDEVQDLVGPRVAFVEALLKRTECGFTVFGDLAQAIYGYQERADTSGDLVAWIGDRYADPVERRTFGRNFRATSDLARSVLEFGPRLRDPSEDPEAISKDLRTFVLGCPSLPSLRPAKRMLARCDRSTAVLSRTNGEALMASRELHRLGVPHRLQRRATERGAAGWLARAATGLGGKATRSDVVAALDDVCADAGGAVALWPVLRSMDPRREDSLDLRRVAERVRSGAIPEALVAQVDRPVIVSTVHRAKGLEFDRVIVCEPASGTSEDPAEENRILYVALTRARSDLFVLDRPDVKGLRLDRHTDRWVRRGFGRAARLVSALEVVPSDVHIGDPAGGWLIDADVVGTQRYLQTVVQSGDPIVLERVPSRGDSAHYAVVHDGRPIGVTSEEFSDDLRVLFGARGRRPARVTDLYVDLVDTVAGHGVTAEQYGLGAHGLWSRVRVCGLGELEFEGGEDEGRGS